MDEMFRLVYPLTVEDNLIYQEKIFLSNKNPSIVDSIRRWTRLSFLLLVILYPLLVFVLTSSLKWTAAIALLAVIIFVLLWMNAAKIYWKRYRSKAKKDMIKIYFEGDALGVVPIEAIFFDEEVTIASEARTKTIRKSDIDLTEITADYILFYTIKYDGSLIPLAELTEAERQQVINWFD
ncbi:hypothetical protein I6N96_05530 [Enterococcus sp. BWM-S5]|uniref:YcxB-like protein domain-containing protein n=1 Tax=Enterococcus larvae TaxID=2794352 RepID=A0ABS4CHK0_9ENTE|nr:hypothetical protein [Enterococcus larvae]MBP1045732.1 hypothetical protein [Enterococcus larvae]